MRFTLAQSLRRGKGCRLLARVVNALSISELGCVLSSLLFPSSLPFLNASFATQLHFLIEISAGELASTCTDTIEEIARGFLFYFFLCKIVLLHEEHGFYATFYLIRPHGYLRRDIATPVRSFELFERTSTAPDC